MGTPFLQCGGHVDLCAQANHNCCRLLRVTPDAQASILVSAGCFHGKSFLAGESHVVMVTWLCHFWQRSWASSCFTHWPNFCVPPMGWGSWSLWFPTAAKSKSHVHKTTLSRGLWGGRALWPLPQEHVPGGRGWHWVTRNTSSNSEAFSISHAHVGEARNKNAISEEVFQQ